MKQIEADAFHQWIAVLVPHSAYTPVAM